MREAMGTALPCQSIWMSATLDLAQLLTADFRQRELCIVELDQEDRTGPLRIRIEATRTVRQLGVGMLTLVASRSAGGAGGRGASSGDANSRGAQHRPAAPRSSMSWGAARRRGERGGRHAGLGGGHRHHLRDVDHRGSAVVVDCGTGWAMQPGRRGAGCEAVFGPRRRWRRPTRLPSSATPQVCWQPWRARR